MKRTSTLLELLKKSFLFLFCFVSITFINTESYGQTRSYATEASYVSPITQSSLLGCGTLLLSPCFIPTVNDPGNATSADHNSYARVNSSAGLLASIGAFQGELELKFPSVVAAGKTSYIRINNNNPDLLNALLGGNLGKLLANVVGTVVLGNRYFEAGARMGTGKANNVLSGNSSNPFSADSIKVIKDVNGYFYIAMTPSKAYDRVYIKDFTNAILGLGAKSYTDVYYAFHGDGTDPCAQGFATSFEGTGLSVDLLGVGKAGVTNMERAIDADTSNFSQISLGVLTVAGSMSQNIFFETLSKSTDEFNIKLKVAPALVNLGLVNNIKLTAYNGSKAVYVGSLSTLLDLDLLGLLNTGAPVAVPFAPGVAFDRVKVTLSALADVNLTQTFNLYSINRSAARPTFAAPLSNALTVCYGTVANLKATTLPANELRWYDAIIGGNLLGTTPFNGTYTTPQPLTASKTYYVAARTVGCTEESVRVPVVVTVNPLINFATTVLAPATQAATYFKQIAAATGGTPAFTYALDPGTSLPAGLALSSAGAIAGTPTETGTFNFSIIATDSKGCNATSAFSLVVTDPLSIPEKLLPNGTVGLGYPVQTIPDVTGGTGPYTYDAPIASLPPGLVFDPATKEITGTPTEAGTYNIPVTVTDVNGNSVTRDYTIVVRDPLALAHTILADGTVNTLYPTQTIPAATGGSGSYTYTATTGLPDGLTFDPVTRQITGTPTKEGTFTFPVQVDDTEGNTKITNYTIVVSSPLLLATKPLADGTVGVVYATETIPAATGGDGNYTYVASNLPPGLTFDEATREIKGNPTKSGSYNVSVKVTDGKGATATQIYVVKVNGELNLPSATLPDGLVGGVYATQQLPAVTGGTSPYTYDLVGLPPALTFEETTREIKGTPLTGGTFTLTMTATDNNGLTTSTDYTLVVNVGAPVVAAVTICGGSAATLSVSNTQPGVTYNWYAATGNTPVFTGTTYTTLPLTANATYYVQAVSGSATSSRTQADVTINAAPAPATVITANETITAGQTASLMVSTAVGNTIKWYTQPTGGASFFTGANYTTPVLNTTTIYYVEIENATGCVSATRSVVKVTVTPPVNVNCNAAGSQQSGIDGLCVACSIENAGNSTDADPNNFTKINLVVGIASSGYQRLIFANPGTATDSIRLDLATPVGLADLSLLGNITVTVYNNNTIVGTARALSSSLIDLKLLSGNRFKATFVAGGVYDRVEIRFGALIGALSNLSIYGAEIIYPNPTVAAIGQTVCSGNAATLSATPNGGTTLAWYAAATGGTALATGNTFTTPTPLTLSTTFYIEVSKGTCANTERVPVRVTVTTAPDVPTLAAASPVCAGSTGVLSVNNAAPGVTYKWYTVMTDGTPVFEGPVFTTGPLNTSTTYYVEAANGSCLSSSRTAALVTVNPLPVLPQVQASATTVSPGQTAILNASSTESNVLFNWYSSANAATPLFTGPTYVTDPLTVATTYYLEAVSSATGCAASNRVQVTINVDNGGVPNPVPCEAAVNESHGADGLAVLANVFNPALAIDNDTKTGSSLVLPVGLLGGSVYQRVGFDGLSNPGDTVRIQLTSPGKLLSLGLLAGITITTYKDNVSNNDPLLINNPLIKLELLSGNSGALLSFVPASQFDNVEVRLHAGIASALTTIDLNYARRITKAPEVISANVSGCETKTATLEVKNPSTALTYTWYDSAGTLVYTGATFETPALTTNTKYYVSANNASGCLSYKTLVNVTVNPVPAQPQLLADNVSICINSSVVLTVGNPQAGLDYVWKKAGIVVQSGPLTTYTIAAVTGPDTYTVLAQNSCGSQSAEATATVDVGTPLPAIITPSAITINKNERAVLTATSTALGAVFTWYDAEPLPGVLPVSTPANGADGTFLTPALASTTKYWVVSEANGCVSAAATVVVTVLDNAAPGDVPCEAAVNEENGVGGLLALLSGVDNRGLVYDNNVNTGSSLRVGVGVGSFVYQRAIFTGLSTVGDKVRLKLTSPANLLSLGVLSSVEVTTYNGVTSNNDTKTISNPLILLELLSGGAEAIVEFTPAVQFDRVEVRLNSGLLGALTSINFNYAQRIIVPPVVQSATATACKGASADLSVKDPVTDGSIIYKWYLGTSTTSLADGPDYQTAVTLDAGDYEFFVVASRNGCLSARTKVNVTILPQPDAPVVIGANPKSTCVNVPATLAVTAVPGVSYTWYDDAVLGNVLATNTASYTTPANLPVGTYNYYISATNGNSCTTAARTLITLVVKSNAIASDITATDQSVCSGSSVTLNASSAITGATFKWYKNPDLSDVPFEGADFPTGILTATTKYYVIVSGNGICSNDASSAKVVTVTVNRNAVASDITASDKAVCAGSGTILNASSAIVGATFKWYKKADLSDIPVDGADFPTGILTATTPYYVTVSGTGVCANDAANAKVVTVTVNRNATDADIIAADKTTCSGTAVILTASSLGIPNAVISWYRDPQLTDLAVRGTSFTTPALTSTTKYYVTVSGLDVCANDAANAKVVTAIVSRNATDADIALDDQTICSGTSAELRASSLVDKPVFRWYRDQSLTDFAFEGPTYTTTALTLTTKYYVTVSGTGVCANGVTTAKVVTVTVTRNAAVTDIISDGQTICSGETAKLSASSPTVSPASFIWYRDAALTDVAFTTANVTTLPLTVTTRYYVTVTGPGVCANLPGTAKVVTVIVNQLPNVPIISPVGTTICSGDGTTLTIQNPQADVTYKWYNAATNGVEVNTGVTFPILSLTSTTDYYVQATNASGCGSATGRVPVKVTVNPRPLIPSVVSAIVNTCIGSTAVLTVSNPVNGVAYNWYDTETSTTILGTGTDFTTLPINTATSTFYVEAKSGSCNSTSRTAVIVNAGTVPLPPPSVSGAENPLCPGSAAVLTVNNPDGALNYAWYAVQTGGTALGEGIAFNVPALTTTMIYYVGSINALTGCASSTRTPITVTVLAKLAAPVVTVQDAAATSITFAWTAIPGATAYEVSIDAGVTWMAPSSGSAGLTHLVANLQLNQNVTIRVRAKGQLDCQTSDATSLTGNSENPLANQLFVPNTFTPNNDGNNDILYVYGNTVAKMKLRVYNQWGQFLYESLNIQNGWDGTFKGQVQPNGVYVYYLEVEFNDGTKANKKGTITLLR
jgi:gliding motility-associated-like protein